MQQITFLIFHLRYNSSLIKLSLKKNIKQPIIQPTPPEIIPNVVPKKDFFIDNDDFDSFKKP